MISSAVPPAQIYEGHPPQASSSTERVGGGAMGVSGNGVVISQTNPPPSMPNNRLAYPPSQTQLSMPPSGPTDPSPTPYHGFVSGQHPQQQQLPPSSQQPSPQIRGFYNGPPAEVVSFPQQQKQQQPQAVRELTSNTPWTLGSTDSSYAINLALFQVQQQLSALNDRSAGPETSTENHEAENHLNDRERGSSAADNVEAALMYEQNADWKLAALQKNQSLYQDRLFSQPSAAVEATLAAACEVMSFDIAEMWLRTGLKTHQLTNSHLRPTALDESTRNDLVDVYYGEKSAERTHRLSPALCKRAKEANDVIWVSAQSERDAEALRASISNVRTAVAVPICHEASNTNVTIIFFSVRR